MTVLKATIEDEQADSLRKLLKDVPYIKKVEEEYGDTNTEAGAAIIVKKYQKDIGGCEREKSI